MNQLPLCLEEIILDYKAQLEHTEKQWGLNEEIRSFKFREFNHKAWSYAWETMGKKKYFWKG